MVVEHVVVPVLISPFVVLLVLHHLAHKVHTSTVDLVYFPEHIGRVELVLVLEWLCIHVEYIEYGSLADPVWIRFVAVLWLVNELVRDQFAQMDWKLIVHFVSNMFGMDDYSPLDSMLVGLAHDYVELQWNIDFAAVAVDSIWIDQFEKFAVRFDNEVVVIE